MPAFANGQSTLKTLTTKTTTAMTPNDNRSSLGASVYTSTASYHSTVLTHPVANLNATATTTTGATVSKAVNSIASIIISNFVPTLFPPTPPRSGNLVVASSGEDLSNFHDVTLDLFDEDDDLFGSPMVFDASDDGLWNGRFAPPPPRPPFFEDEPVLSDGLTTCDLCSWAMPTKSTFIFEGTIEKASELGWPLALIIVSILSALLGAIIMITVVRCKRKKSSNNRNGKYLQPLKPLPIPTLPTPPPSPSFRHCHQHHQNHLHILGHPAHAHHTAYSPQLLGFHNLHLEQHRQQKLKSYHEQQQQLQQHQHYQQPSCCSSSSLTNESNSTNQTNLSTNFRPFEQQLPPPPPSHHHHQHWPNNSPAPATSPTGINNHEKQFRQKSINMFTRPLPPQPIATPQDGKSITTRSSTRSSNLSTTISIGSCSSSRSSRSSSRNLFAITAGDEPKLTSTSSADVAATTAVMVAAFGGSNYDMT